MNGLNRDRDAQQRFMLNALSPAKYRIKLQSRIKKTNIGKAEIKKSEKRKSRHRIFRLQDIEKTDFNIDIIYTEKIQTNQSFIHINPLSNRHQSKDIFAAGRLRIGLIMIFSVKNLTVMMLMR